MTVKNNKRTDLKTLRVDKDIHKRIKIISIYEEIDIKTFVEKILSEKADQYPQITDSNIHKQK